jgi:outer membrane protein
MRSLLVLSLAFASSPALAQAPAPQPATPAPAAPQAPAPPPAPPAAAKPPARVLTFEEAVALARRNAPALRTAQANAQASAALAYQARAPLLPQVFASGTYQRETFNRLPTTFLGGGPSSNFWTFTANLNQSLVNVSLWNQLGAATATARSSADTARFVLQQVLLTVENAFFTARAAKDLVIVAKVTLDNQDAHLKQTEAFVRVGTHPAIDLATAQATRANAVVQLVRAQNGYDTARAALNQAMGVVGPLDYDVASESYPPVEGENLPIDALFAEALKNRPDYQAAEEQVRASEKSVAAAEGGYFPTLGLSTGFTRDGPGFGDLTSNWFAGATLTVPIFQGGLTRGQVSQQRANLSAAISQRDLLILEIRTEVEDARLGVLASVAALSAAKDAVTAAHEQLRLAAGRFRTGVGNAVEYSDGQVTSTNAEAQLVQAEATLAQSRVSLLQALGRI